MDTIISNLAIIWNAPKDWSTGGGLIWLTGAAVVAVCIVVVGIISETRAAAR